MSNERWTRRQFVGRAGKTAGAAVLGLSLADFLAACGQSGGTTGTSGSNKLEIFSWWTGPGEKDGLAEMFKIYTQKYPNVKITNSAVAGGAGSTAKAVLNTRMQGGKPPDSFQVHAGQELISSWVKANKMEPITSIWNSSGWDSTMPKDLKDIVSSNGEVWSVPVNVHRGNALWYNKKLLDGKGVTAPTSPDDMTSALSQLKAKGVQTPLALASKGNWQVQMLLENNILASGGASFYKNVMSGKASFTDPKVIQALTWIKQWLSYVNTDNSAIDWDEADNRLISGTAVFHIMGDWAKGDFTAKNWQPNVDFGVVPSPGTKGNYMIVCDTFGLPKGAPDRDNAVNWLKVCGSQQGQAAFNPKKGSIPARTDVSASIFDVIAQGFMAEFKTDTLVPSSAHGSATPQNFANAVNDEMGQFIQNKDVNKTASNLQKLSDEFLKTS
jgi:glucose/mannose transport system substrate-binding protein